MAKSLGEVYFQQLGIEPSKKIDKARRQAALARSYELRSFEIEHFWKRATHFWGYQAGIFAAFGLLLSGRTEAALPHSTPIAVVGFFTALANLAAARGSKFWQENWEKHIDMLEDEFEGRLHKTVWLDGSCCHQSVSKVNRSLAIVLVTFWVSAVVVTTWLWTDPAGSVRRDELNAVREFLSHPQCMVVLGLVFISLAVWVWYSSLSSLRGKTVLRNGSYRAGCDETLPLSDDSAILSSRFNPVNEQ